MLMFCTSASCESLKDNTGGHNYLDVFLVSCFMVVTSHYVFYFCWLSSLNFSVISMSWLLSKAYLGPLYVDGVVFCWDLCPLVCFFLKINWVGLEWSYMVKFSLFHFCIGF